MALNNFMPSYGAKNVLMKVFVLKSTTLTNILANTNVILKQSKGIDLLVTW